MKGWGKVCAVCACIYTERLVYFNRCVAFGTGPRPSFGAIPHIESSITVRTVTVRTLHV